MKGRATATFVWVVSCQLGNGATYLSLVTLTGSDGMSSSGVMALQRGDERQIAGDAAILSIELPRLKMIKQFGVCYSGRFGNVPTSGPSCTDGLLKPPS